MALVTIPSGGEVLSSPLNDNFTYLDNKISDTDADVATLQSNIQSINSTLNGKINELDAEMMSMLRPIGQPIARLDDTLLKMR